MPRSIRSRPFAGASVHHRRQERRHAHTSASDLHRKSLRVIGTPIPLTLPKLQGLIPRYCSRSDDQTAAKLALSMLRIGVSRADDWKGGVVDFIAKGLSRFCQQNGSTTVARVFPESGIRIMDELLERSEVERSQTEATDGSRMFVLVDYEQAAMVPVGDTLAYLGTVHELLPAAVYQVFSANLSHWMRVYDYRDAEFYAKDAIEMLEEEELKESFYPQVESARSSCLNNLPEYAEAVEFLEKVVREISHAPASTMVRHCLAMHELGESHEPAWPGRLQKRVAELEEYFECTDEPGPGSLIVFDEEDLIEACFAEQMQYLGQDYSIGSTQMLVIDLNQSPAALDRQVKEAFDYLGAMLEALSHATELIEMIRGMYGEKLRQRGMESGVPTKEGAAAVR